MLKNGLNYTLSILKGIQRVEIFSPNHILIWISFEVEMTHSMSKVNKICPQMDCIPGHAQVLAC